MKKIYEALKEIKEKTGLTARMYIGLSDDGESLLIKDIIDADVGVNIGGGAIRFSGSTSTTKDEEDIFFNEFKNWYTGILSHSSTTNRKGGWNDSTFWRSFHLVSQDEYPEGKSSTEKFISMLKKKAKEGHGLAGYFESDIKDAEEHLKRLKQPS